MATLFVVHRWWRKSFVLAKHFFFCVIINKHQAFYLADIALIISYVMENEIQDGQQLGLNNQQQTTVETPEGENKTDSKTRGKEEYRLYGQLMQEKKERESVQSRLQQLETRMQPKEEEDFGDLDPDHVKFMDERIQKKAERIAEQKFDQILQQRQQSELYQKEEKAFISANPEAIQHLDAINNFRKNVDSNASLASARKVLAPMYWIQERTPAPIISQGVGSTWSQQQTGTTRADDDEAIAKYYWMKR